jgi:hypothetical protein
MEFNSISYFLPLVGVDQLSVCTGPELIDRAIAELRNGIELDPTFWFFHTLLGSAYLQKGKMREAIAEYQ